jgi:hypothetical protein
MSVLETPRLIFRGRVTWDPIVTNNRPQQYDEADGKTVFNSSAASVAAFREDAIDAVINSGNWNPHGTHRATFYETSIVGVDNGNGPSTDDPIVKNPVSFIGMLVDLEPYGAYSSQLFFDAMSFGIQGGCRVFAPRTTRMTSRYINFARNTTFNPQNNPNVVAGGASVVWQTSFSKNDGLHVDAHDSSTLIALNRALEGDDVIGLTVRWNAYLTLYFNSRDPSDNPALAQQLHDKLVGGGFQPNPARSQLVGVLGLWRKGEPAGEPGDRALLTPQPRRMASAHVRISGDQLSIDLANSVPETGVDLTKLDLGDLTVVAIAPGGSTVVATLGTFGYKDYRREAYDGTAGIVTIKIEPSAAQQVQNADIQLRQHDGTVLLAEAALRAIPSAANTYLDEGETTALDVSVLDRGNPAGSGINVTMSNPDSTSGASVKRTTNAQGIATFPLAGTTGQIEGFVFTPGQAPPASQIVPQTTTYAYVRTLPADASIAALEPTWVNVHGRVLRNWHAMAPCMDNWLDLGNPNQVKSFAAILHRLTAKNNFESFLFMPVTRDMTVGERALLYKFLDGAPVLTEAAAAPPEPSLKHMSRAMRGG